MEAKTLTAADALTLMTNAYPWGNPADFADDAAALAALFNDAVTGPQLRRLMALKCGPLASSVALECRRFMIAAAHAAGLKAGRWVSMADTLPGHWPAHLL